MAPQSVVRGVREAGIGPGDAPTWQRANIPLKRRHPATELHLHLEDTASPFAGRPIHVVAFRASHSAKPPLRQRDLFRSSLVILSKSSQSISWTKSG